MRSRNPVIMTLFYFYFLQSNLVKIAMQLSSQSCPLDIREPVVRSFKTMEDCALGESLVDIFNVDSIFGLLMLPFATCTLVPYVVCTMWEQCSRAYG